jgi:hypothetical protein
MSHSGHAATYAASSFRFDMQNVCVRPTPPLSHALPPRGPLRSASHHLALLDRRKRQAAQLRVSFTLTPPVTSLARPCSTAARTCVRPA